MVKSMFAAVAGLRAHQTKMDVIGNNIANVNTYGFKKARATFKDQFYATLNGASAPGASLGGGNPSQIGYGSQIGSIDVAHGTGGIAATDIPTDVMISGGGYFMVGGYNPAGYATSSNAATGNDPRDLNLTRVGIFYFDGNGGLVDGNRNHVYGFKNYAGVGEDPKFTHLLDPNDPLSEGKTLNALEIPKVLMNDKGEACKYDAGQTPPLIPLKAGDPYVIVSYDAAGKATIPNPAGGGAADIELIGINGASAATMKLNSVSISIGNEGTVSGVNDKGQNVIIGKIALANVPNPNALESTNGSYFKAKENTGVVTGNEPTTGGTGGLNSGKVEMSNVDLSQEFTDMITTQRGFQANTRIITVTDQMLEELVNLKR